MITRPLVTISIAYWNGLEDTKECLESLRNITYKNVEIIVVDNGSTDKTSDFIQANYPKIIIIKNTKNLGFTGAHNIAIQNTRGKYFLLLNNDTKLKKDFLEPLVEDLEKNPSVAAVQSKIYLDGNKKILDNVGSFLTPVGFLKHFGFKEKNNAKYESIIQVFSPKGAGLLMRKALIDKIGLFDTDYFAYFEETDWAWRAYLSGYKIWFEPRSIIFHKLGQTSTKLSYSFVAYNSFKNTLRTILKNASGVTLLYMIPLHFLAIEFLAVSFLVQGKIGMFWAIVRAQIWNVFHISKTLRLRHQIQQSRKITDKELFMFAMKAPDIKSSLRQYLQIKLNS